LWLAADGAATAEASAGTQDTDYLPAATEKHTQTVTAQADPPPASNDVAQGAASPDGNAPQVETDNTTATAAEQVTDTHGPAHEHGSSTPLQLIEEQLLSERAQGLLEISSEHAKPPLPGVSPKPVPHAAIHGSDVTGTDGRDVIIGTLGADTLSGAGGNDHIFGRAGNDTLHGDDGNDKVFGGSGDDGVSGDAGNDLTIGGSGKDTMDGGTGDDKMLGGAGNDTMSGGDGNDKMHGGVGNDTMDGGAGDDVIAGGQGADGMTGGDGNDSFKFIWLSDGGTTDGTRDHVLDFKQGEDKIDLTKIDADFDALGNQAFTFVGSVAFSSSHGELRYQHIHDDNTKDDHTFIELNTNGDGQAQMQIDLHGLFTMTPDDFLL
jgi:Ca2+-binding RTX toxin-like protein